MRTMAEVGGRVVSKVNQGSAATSESESGTSITQGGDMLSKTGLGC